VGAAIAASEKRANDLRFMNCLIGGGWTLWVESLRKLPVPSKSRKGAEYVHKFWADVSSLARTRQPLVHFSASASRTRFERCAENPVKAWSNQKIELSDPVRLMTL